jgi:hypothetical protein
VADALKLAPVQKDVQYEQPSAAEAPQCTIKAEKFGKTTAWVVRHPKGRVLRQFSDVNSDNVVDTWSYFSEGLEVYRDIDTNNNGKADQCRWFHTAGSRIGLDRNEDATIDAWERLSPEEAASEAIAALSTGDAGRFAAVLPSDAEIGKLGLAEPVAKQLATRVAETRKAFAAAARGGATGAAAEFTDFGGLRPGLVPAGTRGSTRDLLVYENAWAMFYNGKQHEQLQLGTMIQVGAAWKLIDLPVVGNGSQAASGFFYQTAGSPSPEEAAGPENGPSEEMQQILTAMEKLDDQIASAAPGDLPQLSAQRADLLFKLAEVAPTRGEQEQWLRQMADMVSAAVQGGQYPEGAKRLQQMEQTLAKSKASEDLLTHFAFRRMQAEQGLKFADPKANHAKIQEEWVAQLQEFVTAHPQSEHAGEALLQLAMYSEFGGEAKQAQDWYAQLDKQFADTPNAAKARGALVRLNCVGKSIDVAGAGLQGGAVKLSDYAGKTVLLHYWSASGVTSKADHAVIKDVYAKYAGQGFEVLGVNLDYQREQVARYLQAQQLPWKTIFEEGGFESRLANEMGVITLPMFLLIDADGKVVNNDLQAAELEDALKQLLDDRAAGRPSERR